MIKHKNYVDHLHLQKKITIKDYWTENRWSYGLTLGISAPLL